MSNNIPNAATLLEFANLQVAAGTFIPNAR